ncbi:ankyrin repeat-containing domain protein [Colletotrichum godetiae]|uniref:Ankyrin repeat-containing domain protein n=1 Tax=Colletotrichum godetiae TaxID=1209918 RepID=A0AAJ0APA8_9PEZI|nr:ankyrin repeat-containing domain protein [Colletotrichum godetiae]KAK1676859.1 ankyrin repeat-containing domain protein [Colletotrichum godetiae]
MTNLHNLPPEIKTVIVNELARQKILLPGDEPIGYEYADTQLAALAALARTNKFFNVVATPMLYDNGVRRHPYLLCWATDIGNVEIMKKLLWTGLIDPNDAIIRFQAEYSPWDPNVESSKELFYRFYRRDGHCFQSQGMYRRRLTQRNAPMDEIDALYGYALGDEWSRSESGSSISTSTSAEDGFPMPLTDSASDSDSESEDTETSGGFDDEETGSQEELRGQEDAGISANDGAASEAPSTGNSSDDDSSEDASVSDDYSDGEDVGSEDGTDTVAAPAHATPFPLPDVGVDSDDDSDDPSEWGEPGRVLCEADVTHVMYEGYLRFPDYDDREDMDNTDIEGMYWKPIHIAARMGNMEALELLLNNGALVNVSSQGFCRSECHQVPGPAIYWEYPAEYPAWTPLHVALCHGHIGVAKRMMEHCEYLQERLLNFNGMPWQVLPRFISAIRHGHMDLAEWCLQQGWERDAVNAKNAEIEGATMLFRVFWEATDAKNFEAALEVLLRNGADINHDLGKGQTVLMEACLWGFFDEAIALIKAGAKVDITLHGFNQNIQNARAYDGRRRDTPIVEEGCGLLEICCGPTPVLRQPRDLIDATLHSRVSYPRRRAPDWKTDSSAQREVVRLLLDSPARAVGKRNPLQIACSSHNVETLSMLLDLGMDAASASTDNLTPLESVVLGYDHFSNLDAYIACMDLLRQHLSKRSKSKDSFICTQTLQNVLHSGMLYYNTNNSRRVWAALVDFVTGGLADGNIQSEGGITLLMTLFHDGFDMHQLAMRLLEHGVKTPTKTEWYGIWSNMNVRVQAARFEPRASFASSEEAYSFCKAMDPKEHFLHDPFYLAAAMATKQQSLVDAIVKYGHMQNKWWITYPVWVDSPDQPPYVPAMKEAYLRQHDAFEDQPAGSSKQPESVKAIDAGSDIECESDERCLCTGGTHEDDCFYFTYPKSRHCLVFLTKRHAGWSLFHLAIRFRQYDVVKKLVEEGVDVNETTKNGWSPGYIMCVKEWFDEKIVKYLVAHGVNPHVGRSGRWASPLHYARQEGADPRAADLMLEAFTLSRRPSPRKTLRPPTTSSRKQRM